MPQVGWEMDGQRWSLEEALQIAREETFFQGFPKALIKQLQEDERPVQWISPSMAGGCLRQTFLRREHDYHLDPRERYAMGIGSAIHDWLSVTDDGGHILKEVRLKYSLGGEPELILSGQIDRFDIKRGVLLDYKTTNSVWRKDRPNYQYTLQQNLYVYLLRKHGYEVNEIFLWYAVPRPKRKKVGEGEYITEVDRLVVEIPIWTEEEQQAALDELETNIRYIMATGDLPPRYAADDEDAWRCRFCPVEEICMDLTLSELEESLV